MDDPERMRTSASRRLHAAWRRLLREEDGIALILAIVTMLVLTITLTGVIFLTAAGARDAHRTNAGQKASALAESGINNALAVLKANYDLGTTIYPGDPTLLLSTTLTSPVTTLPASTTINVASTSGFSPGPNMISVGSSGPVTCTSTTLTSFTGCTGGAAGTYPTGTVVVRATAFGVNSATWSGSLVNVPTNPKWKWQWQLTASGRVKNPTGPAADVVRNATAVVPVVIPDSTSVDPNTSALDWVYGLHDVTFGQSVNVASPVYAGHDIILANTATISETIPASLTLPARPNRIVAEHDLSLVGPQNRVGHVNGSADPANDLAEIHVGHYCASQGNPTPHPCVWGATDKIWGVVHDNTIPHFNPLPSVTCCSPLAWAAPADGTSHPASPSDMGFWYLNAGLGPKTPCATSTGTPPRFDTSSGTADDTINESAYSRAAPFQLIGGATYSCTSADGQTKLAWDGTTLTIKGTVFIDGSATISNNGTVAKYVGKGTIILTGLFSMSNNTALCANLSGSSCNTSAPWDADTTALAIIAGGIDTSQLPAPGTSISIKKGNFQGLLLANGNIDGSVSGTVIIGPMVSAYGSVNAGQSGTLQFPPITFASSGTDGFTGPLPIPQLLPPIQFGGG
jgi:Tfp pilus assembly protein PilX